MVLDSVQAFWEVVHYVHVIHRTESTHRHVLQMGLGSLSIGYYECVSLVRPIRTAW